MPTTTMYSPSASEVLRNRARRVANPLTGNSYQLDILGSAPMDNTDVPYFSAAEEFLPIPTAGSGQVLLKVHAVVTSAYARNITHPISGNQYLVNQQGYVVVAQADAPYFQTQGYTIPTGTATVFPPLANGQQATVAADFVNNLYWASGSVASFAAWVTALGGAYTRASTASYYKAGVLQIGANAAATNTPRFPTDINGVPLGIRLTGAVTNTLLQSNSLTTAPWTNQNSTPVQNVTGPDGVANSAWSVIDTPGVTNQLQQINAGTFTAQPQTVSWFAQKNTSPTFVAQITDQTAGATSVFVTNFTWQASGPPTLSNQVGNAVGTVVMTPLANNWWRFEMRFTALVNGNQMRLIFYPESTGNGTGVGTNFYGFQVNNLPFAGDYVPTAAASATQAADSLTFPFTQQTFSALAIVSDQVNTAPSWGPFLAPSVTTNDSYVGITSSGGTFSTYNNLAGTLVAPAFAGALGATHKLMVAGSNAGRSITVDGAVPLSDATALTSAAPTGMRVGGGNLGPTYGDILQMAVWSNIVASAAEMVRLTT